MRDIRSLDDGALADLVRENLQGCEGFVAAMHHYKSCCPRNHGRARDILIRLYEKEVTQAQT